MREPESIARRKFQTDLAAQRCITPARPEALCHILVDDHAAVFEIRIRPREFATGQ
jgi:hypothetical protein